MIPTTFVHALQFLTRLPAPRIEKFDPEDFSRSAAWFPVIGLIIGAFLALAVWVGSAASPWIGALFGLVMWVWITGGLHLDGLGDVSDAFGAAHRSPERFLEVLRDPHIGAFGAMAIGVQLIAKLVLLSELTEPAMLVALVIVPAWARWGGRVLSIVVPPLASGTAERFSWNSNRPLVAIQGVALALVSAWLAPALLVALLITPALAAYWKKRLGGISGDCLGASTEVTETLLLVSVIFVARLVG